MPVSISQDTTVYRICEWKSIPIFELVDRLNSVYSHPERKKDFSFSCEYQGVSYYDIQEIHSLDWFLRLAARGQWFIKEKGEIE